VKRIKDHSRAGSGGYPEVFGFKEYWIPDKDLQQ
jgi:hypothetical protein